MRILFSFLLALLFFGFIFASTASAQVVINEFSPSEEWVELYNIGVDTVDITGWSLKDITNPPKVLSGIIEGGKYFVYQNSGNWLNNDDPDSVTLTRGDASTHTISYGITGGVCQPDNNTKSIGSFADGQANIEKFDRFSVSTKNANNSGGVLNPCSMPTQDPTTTPTSTPTPTPTPTPVPAKTPTPKATPTKSPTPRASTTPAPLNQETDDRSILGLREGLQASSSPEPGSGSGKSFPLLAVGFVLVGGSLMAFGGYTFLKTRRAYTSRGG